MTTPKTGVTTNSALPGRSEPILTGVTYHEVFGTPLEPVPDTAHVAYFALGCFWGAEKLFWQLDGVISTAVGYQGGITPNPTYEEVCTGNTAHAETVRVVFDPNKVSYRDLLKVFYENHDPTQGNRQGNDIGTQYRSALFPVTDTQQINALAVTEQFASAFDENGYGTITTDITEPPTPPFYLAERYHQQYLEKNPQGYCPVHATGVTCNAG